MGVSNLYKIGSVKKLMGSVKHVKFVPIGDSKNLRGVSNKNFWPRSKGKEKKDFLTTLHAFTKCLCSRIHVFLSHQQFQNIVLHTNYHMHKKFQSLGVSNKTDFGISDNQGQ